MTSSNESGAAGWQEPVELAIKHADLATKIVQFFVLASVAVGGWVISSEELRVLPPFAGPRVIWAALYTLMAMPLWFALVDLQIRINALYRHVLPDLPDQLRGVARPFEPRLVNYGFPLFVLAVDLIILMMHDSAAA
jgi:hypothetical protein